MLGRPGRVSPGNNMPTPGMTIVHYSHKINLLYFTGPRLDTFVYGKSLPLSLRS
jgi:hypothetical protein